MMDLTKGKNICKFLNKYLVASKKYSHLCNAKNTTC